MAGCYDKEKRVGSKSRGTRSQFRLNTQSLVPFKCTHPVYLTEIMDTSSSVQAGSSMMPRSGRTVREYDQEIEELRKENFNLKLRLYFLEQKYCRSGGDNGQSSPVEIEVQLTYEIESLQNEIASKSQLLQDALSQAERYEGDLQIALKENAEFQSKIDAILKDTGPHIEELKKENDELTKGNEALQEKVRKASQAIQGFVTKFNEDYELLPKDLRPIIINAVKAARDSNRNNVVSSVDEFKDYLCQIMSKPYGDVFEDVASKHDASAKDQIQCLEKEVYKQKKLCRNLEKKFEASASESKKSVKELEDALSKKEAELHELIQSQELQANDEVVSVNQNQLTEKDTAIDLLKNLLMRHLGSSDAGISNVYQDSNVERDSNVEQDSNVQRDRNSSSLLTETQTEYLQSIDSVLNENQEIFENHENLKVLSKLVADVMSLNSRLNKEVKDQLVEINRWTATCDELEQNIINLERDLGAAKSNMRHLESKSKEKAVKFDKILSRLNKSAQTDMITREHSMQTSTSNQYLPDFIQTDENDLKAELRRMSLTIQQREIELQELNHKNAFYIAKLEEAKNQIEMNSIHMEEGYSSEVAKLHKQLAQTHYVNIELVKQLQSLEVFMENIVEHKNLELSSFENISEPDSFSKLSRCLNKIRVLSSTLSENLSVCEGSKVFDVEDLSMTLNSELLKNLSTVEKQGSYVSVVKPTFKSLAYSDVKDSEGKGNLANNETCINQCSARTGKRRTWSNSVHLHADSSIFNSDCVSVLRISDDEDTMIQADDGTERPYGFENAEQNLRIGDSATIPAFLNPDLGIRNSFPRRRCWGDEFTSFSFFTNKNPDLSPHLQPTDSKTALARYDGNTNLCAATWYNSCLTSDSDIWSEPDRDVSMQRIGIEIKNSPNVPKSPSHKLRLGRNRQTTDGISSEKSSVGNKAQTWSRKRRSSGSTPKRLCAKRDTKLDKHLSLLREECPRFVALLHQFETTKELNVEKAEVLADTFEILKRLQCTISDTTEALVILRDKSKNGAPVSCLQCIVNDLKLEIENSMEKINGANVIQEIMGTTAEQVVHSFISEVDNLSKQLEVTLDTCPPPPPLRSLQFASEQQLPTRVEIESQTSHAVGESISKKNMELERKLSLSLQNTADLNILINQLKFENNQLEEKQIRYQEDALSSSDLCKQLETELKQTKVKLQNMMDRCSDLEKQFEKTSNAKKQVSELLDKCEAHEDEIMKLQEMLKNERVNAKNLKDENDEFVNINKRLTASIDELKENLSEASEKVNDLKKSVDKAQADRDILEEQIVQLKTEAISSKTENEELIEANRNLEFMCSKLQKQMSDEDVNVSQLRSSFNKLEFEKSKSEEELGHLKSRSQSLYDYHRQLSNELEQTKLHLEESRSRISLIEKEMQEKNLQVELLQKDNDVLKESKKTLKSICDQLEKKLSDEGFNVSQIKKSFDELKLQKKKSEIELQHSKTNVHNIYDYNRQLTNELEETKSKLEESNSKILRLDKELHEKKSKVNMLETDLNEHVMSQNKLKAICSQMEKKLSSEGIKVIELKKSVDKLKVENSKSESELTHLKASSNSLNNQHRQIADELQQAESKLEDSHSRISILEKEIQAKKLQVELLRNDNDELMRSRTELQAMSISLEKELSDKGVSGSELKESFEKLKLEKKKSDLELDHLRTSSLNIYDLNRQLNDQLQHSELRLEESVSKCHEYENKLVEMSKIEKEAVDLMKKYEEQSAAVKRVTDEKQNVENVNEVLNEKLKSMDVQLDSLKDENNNLLTRKKSLETINEELNKRLSSESYNNKRLESLNKELEVLKSELEEKLMKLKSTSDSLHESRELLRNRLEETELQLENTISKCDHCEKELLSMTYLNKQDELVQKCENQKAVIIKLQEMLKDEENKLESLKKGKEELELLNSNLTKENNSLANELKIKCKSILNLQMENEQARGDLASTSSRSDLLSKSLKTAQEALKTVEEKCSYYELELKDSLTSKNQLEQEIHTLEAKCKNLDRALGDAMVKKDSFIQKMQTLKSKLVCNKSKLNDAGKMHSFSKVLSEKDIENKENEMFILPSSKSVIQTKDKQLEELCENIIVENDGLTEYIEMLMKKLNEYEIALKESTADERKYQNKITFLENQVRLREEKLTKMSDKEVESFDEEQQLGEVSRQASTERHQQIVSSFHNQLKSAEDKIAYLEKQNEQVLNQSVNFEKEHHGELAALQNQLEVRDFELTELKQARDTLLSEIEKRKTCFQDEQVQTFDSVQNLDEKTAIEKSRFDHMQNKVKILEVEVANLKKLKEQVVLQKRASGERMQQIVTSVQSQLKIREDQIADLKKQRDQLLTVNQSFEKKHQYEIASIQKQFKICESQLAEFKKQHEILLAKIEEKQTLIDEREKSVAFLRPQLQSLQQQNISFQNQIYEEKLNSKTQENEITNLHKKIFNLQLEINKSLSNKHDIKSLEGIEPESKELNTTRRGGSVTPISYADPQAEELRRLQSHPSPIKLIYSKYSMGKKPRTHSITPDKLDSRAESLIPTKLTSAEQSSDKNSIVDDVLLPSTTSLDSSLSNLSIDTDSTYYDSLKHHKIGRNLELMKEIKSLRERLAVAEDQIEVLEKEKCKIREHLTAQVSDKKSILKMNVDEKLDYQLQLDRKESFIEDLKDELFRTNSMMMSKQKEMISLEKTISEYENGVVHAPDERKPQKLERTLSSKLVNEITALKNENFVLKTELMEFRRFEVRSLSSTVVPASQWSSQQYSFLDSENSVVSVDAERVKELRKLKWEFVKSIFLLQKQFCEGKALDFNDHQKLISFVERQCSLRFSNQLSKCISEPILRSPTRVCAAPETKEDSNLQNVHDLLELDIECLHNFKMFLEKFVLPNVGAAASKDLLTKNQLMPEVTRKLSKIPQLELRVKELENEINVLRERNITTQQLPLVGSLGSIERLRATSHRISSLVSNKGDVSTIALKIGFIQDVFQSLESDFKLNEILSHAEIHEDDTYSESVKRSLLLKLVPEIQMLQTSADKVFQLNSTLKSICAQENLDGSKYSIAERDLFADDTLTLSRSASLSPVSFEDMQPSKETLPRPHEDVTRTDDKPTEISRTSRRFDESHSTYKLQIIEVNAASSQDSVCHRSHFSSPDLGIESDPNHESSAPEQTGKEPLPFSAARKKAAPPSEQSEPDLKFKYGMIETQLRWPFSVLDNMRSKDYSGAMGDTLYAIGALQDYELLKQEIQESLIEIKSVLSRSKDGIQHIAKYASPRKSLEHSTFKAIRDTCSSIEVYLSEAAKVVDKFCVAPYPTAEEWNSLIQQNKELNETLNNLRWQMQKQKNEFNDAMKELQNAQMVKEAMEKKMSKKLVKTKKVLRLAKMQLREPNLVTCLSCQSPAATGGAASQGDV